MRRNRYELTNQEISEFNDLKPDNPARVWAFWHKAATDRDLDPSTILCDELFPNTFTALSPGHQKHWCWPWSLTLNKRPAAHF